MTQKTWSRGLPHQPNRRGERELALSLKVRIRREGRKVDRNATVDGDADAAGRIPAAERVTQPAAHVDARQHAPFEAGMRERAGDATPDLAHRHPPVGTIREIAADVDRQRDLDIRMRRRDAGIAEKAAGEQRAVAKRPLAHVRPADPTADPVHAGADFPVAFNGAGADIDGHAAATARRYTVDDDIGGTDANSEDVVQVAEADQIVVVHRDVEPVAARRRVGPPAEIAAISAGDGERPLLLRSRADDRERTG